MGKLKKFWLQLFYMLDDFLAYILTIVGILCSNYLPLLKTNSRIDIAMDWWRIGLASVVALLVIGKQESLDIDENGSIDKSRTGRKKRFTIRMINALSQGIMWATFINLT
jgi:hypothetical protein